MADKCESFRATARDVYWSHFHTIHFCQFLTRDFHSRLMIPKKFADNKRGELQEKLGIRGPNGASWEVALLKTGDDGMLYFGDGWEEFVAAYALRRNDILIFKYTGNSRFDVFMLDPRTLCEREDSYFVSKCDHAKIPVEIAQDDDDDKEFVSSPKKKPRVEPDGEESNQRSVTQSQKTETWKKACKELSDESFAIVMRATHVYKSFFLTVPAQWITRHLIQGNQDVILRVGGSPWKVKMIFNSRGRAGFAGGWREFAIGNSLEEYDVCLFKLDDPKGKGVPITLDVAIFRVVPEAVSIPRIDTLRRLTSRNL